jgi:hypothetical protein
MVKSHSKTFFDSQKDLISTKRRLLEGVVKIKLAEASLQQAQGVLLEKYGIEIDD